jgi:CheY-like chemotaxis protein
MSGVVNKNVAEKAIAVKADELIRKPFQPQELIGRVRALLQSKANSASPAEPRGEQPLNAIFTPAHHSYATPQQSAAQNQAASPPPAATRPQPEPQPSQIAPMAVPGEFAWPRALAEAMGKQPEAKSAVPQHPPSSASVGSSDAPSAPRSGAANQSDVQRLRNEIMRLELLVRKLQTELTIEKQYCSALELHIRTLQES